MPDRHSASMLHREIHRDIDLAVRNTPGGFRRANDVHDETGLLMMAPEFSHRFRQKNLRETFRSRNTNLIETWTTQRGDLIQHRLGLQYRPACMRLQQLASRGQSHTVRGALK